MAYGLSIDNLLLEEMTLQIGTWTAPQSLVSTVDPISSFTGDLIGYIKGGTTSIKLNRSYVTASSGTPAIKLRKDLITKDFMANVELFNYNTDVLALAMGLLTDTTGNYDIAHIGPRENTCTASFNGYLFSGRLVDCTPVYIGIYYAKITTEDTSINLASDYATIPLQIEAFTHPNFTTSATDTQKSYGLIWFDNT